MVLLFFLVYYFGFGTFRHERVNPFLSPNNDLSHVSHYNIKGLLVRELIIIENMITQV